MKTREYAKSDGKGNYVKAYPVNEGWEIEINCRGKALKYGASNCSRTFWGNRNQAVEVVNGISHKGIEYVYSEEHKRQFGY